MNAIRHQDWDPSFIQLMKNILCHLLEDSELPRQDWEEIMMKLLLVITDEVQPQLRIRDTFNMNHYIKIKKVPGGLPTDSYSINGVVLSKTVAHKGMIRKIKNPVILILNFELDATTLLESQEYLRFERLLAWERDHMNALVSEIINLKPHIVLVASHVPHTIIERLNNAKIAVAYNIKREKLDAIARCTDATVFNYKNELWNAKTITVSQCGLFEPLTILHEFLPNRRKTFLIFRECPKERGATIILRGGDLKTLETVKLIMKFMVNVVNNINIEAQLRKEFIGLRSYNNRIMSADDDNNDDTNTLEATPINSDALNIVNNRPTTVSSYHGESVTLSDNMLYLETQSISALSVAESQVTVNTVDKKRTHYHQQTTTVIVDDDDICLTAVNAVLKQYQTTTLSMSLGVTLPVPHLLLKLRETQKRLIGLIRERLGATITGTNLANESSYHEEKDSKLSNHTVNPDHPIQNENKNKSNYTSPTIPPIPTDLIYMQDYLKSFDAYLEHDLEYRHYQDLHLQCWLMYKKYIGFIPLQLSPIYHQRIIVYRTINPMDDHTIPCEKAVLDPYEYYNPLCDCTLGQYILNSVKEAYYTCSSQICGGPLIFHDRTYSHGNAQIKVQMFVEEDNDDEIDISRDEYLNKIPILICTHCNICNITHKWKPIPELLARYSFGKFLELLFYQSEPIAVDEGCPHGFYRDHSISFRIQNLSVNFTHHKVKVVDVFPPQLHLKFSSKQQRDIKDAALESTRSKIAKFFDSIIERNKSFSYDIVHPNIIDLCKEYLKELSQEALKNKKHLLQKLQMEYATSAPTDTLQLNNVLADLQNHAVAWDLKYIAFARRFIRPERELRRLTTNHLRKMFPAENLDNTNVSTNLDLRTKKAIEAVDLPLLDVGLFDNDENSDDTTINNLLQKPILSESPTTTELYPWFHEEKRFDQMFLQHEKDLDSIGDNNIKNSSESPPKINLLLEEDASRDLDPSVARRLSLELMKDSPNKKKIVEKKIQEEKSQKYLEESKIIETDNTPASSVNSTPLPSPMALNQQQLIVRNNIKPIFSSAAYKRFAELLPPDPLITKSKNSSQTVQKKMNSKLSTHSYHKAKQYFEASTANNTFGNNTFDTKIQQQQPQQRQSQQQQQQQQQQTSITKPNAYRGSPYSAKIQDRPPIAYRYGFMGSLADMYPLGEKRLGVVNITHPISSKLAASKGNPLVQTTNQELSIIRPRSRTMAIVDGSVSNSNSSKISVLGQQLSSINRNSVLPETQHETTSLVKYVSTREYIIKTRNNLSDNKITRTIRQRLPSKASLEPYTKIKEVMHEESSSDDDDDALLDGPVSVEHDEPSTFGHKAFSLFHMDEYDECLGREIVPSILELQEFEEEHKVQMANNTLPFLSLESGIVIGNKKDLLTPKGTDMPLENLTLESGSSSFDWSTNSSGRNSIMKAITYVLAEKSISNLAPLEYPFSPNEHIFADSNILVREDEPSSIISYMLGSALYNEKLQHKQQLRMSNVSNQNPFYLEMFPDETSQPWRFAFEGGSTNFSCKIYFAEQFDMLRKSCGCDEIFISSLARCTTYDASGGKSGSIFLKTKDERFLIKQISKYEMDAFSGSANKYFIYMFNEVFDKGIPTVLCKIFGLYRIGFYNNASGKSMKMDILVMENLFYDIPIKQVFDLKGSMRNRYAEKTGKDVEVFLDENLVEIISKTPLYMKVDTKYNLSNSLYNDTQFLLSLDVMDYSLLVGFVEDSDEIVVGIVDFIRTFTWDKKLESWVKESGMLGGGKKDPTIVSPKMYRKRFRSAIDLYFCMIPDFWTPL
ncbi:uncharacterized protein BX663DRAFT_525376 [Cokeromyces recurvatus]|uniref:uncharacterized protein n=1 Tax=Cokeromyces recurvatus TaxID=90255 RepID=UPI0022206AB3|nr:uncharacterized protein BX663DRAFT_525376 [Cokeromyces recurvatus]KAI7898306.1 hypothetical protein BX663DRAFT_525376 [Cokeromyces recurvatus]